MATVGVGAMLAGLLWGCSSSASTACEGKPNAVTICANGKPIDFSREKNGPHVHEAGSIYAPVEVLGQALGIPVAAEVSADGKSARVTINGKAFAVKMASGAKGIHVHDGETFVPLKEFAAAAGLMLDLNVNKGTAGFAK
jgi:hypothetical protein